MRIYKQFILSGLVITLFASSCFGQLLWKISGNGIPSPSYLFGTIHVMPKEKFDMKEKVQKAFTSCTSLALEIDLNMDLKTKIQMAQEAMIPEGKTLKDLMDSKQYDQLKNYCLDTLRISKKKFSRYEKLKPFFFSAFIMKEQMGKTVSFEEKFMSMAKKKSMKSFGLESIQDQLKAINSISLEDQAKMLTEEIMDVDDSFSEMLELYLKEDIQGLYKMIGEASGDMPDFEFNLLESRNANWVPVIEKNVHLQSVFFAVGAGHLPGNKGLLELLKQKGYQVEAVE